MADDLADRNRRKITRRRGACTYCRRKKIRCNGEKPCTLCQRHSITCSYVSQKSDTSSAEGDRPLEDEWRRSRTTSEVDFSIGAPELQSQDPDPRRQSAPSLSLDMDSIDRFMTFPTPATSSFDTLVDDFVLSPITGGILSPRQGDISSSSDLYAIDPLLDAVTMPELDEVCLGTNNETFTQAGVDQQQTKNRNEMHLPHEMPLQLPAQAEEILLEKRICKEERQRVFFPALSCLEKEGEMPRSQFDPSTSPLISILSLAEVDEATRQKAARAIRRIMSQECQRSLPASWWVGASQKAGLNFDWNGLPIQSLICACFEEPLGVQLYLEQREVLSAAKSFQYHLRKPSHAVNDSIVATLVAWGSVLKSSQHTSEHVEMITLMMDAFEILSTEEDSLEKLLAMVAVLQFADKLAMKILPKLVTAIISIIQSLSLHSEPALQSQCAHSQGLATRVKRACWVVFCVDKVNTLRWKSFSLFPDSCVQYAPPPLGIHTDNQDWLLAQCTYAKLCSRIHYKKSSTRVDDDSCLSSETTSIAAELQEWYQSLPNCSRDRNQKNTMSDAPTERIGICMLYQFCEASLALLDVDKTSRQAINYPQVRPGMITLFRQIFDISYRIEPKDLVYDRILLFLPSFSLCRMVIEVLTNGTADFEDSRAVLAVAHGYFSRTSSMLPTLDFFNHITELIDIAVEAHKQKK